MDTSSHSLENLFLQLGLDNHPDAIARFISSHPLTHREAIEDALFWTPSQAAFISECLAEDSDWAEVVDQLNVLLHH